MVKARDIQFYDHRTQKLEHSQQYKIRKLIELGCIKKLNDVPDYAYACLHIPGYNKTTYLLGWKMGNLTCTCQHFTMTGRPCAHIGAVWEFRARNGELGQGELF